MDTNKTGSQGASSNKESAGQASQHQSEKSNDLRNELQRTKANLVEAAKDGLGMAKERVSDLVENAKEKLHEGLHQLNDKLESRKSELGVEGTSAVAEKFEDLKEKATEMKDKVASKLEAGKDKVEEKLYEGSNTVKEKLQQGTNAVKETGNEVKRKLQ